MHHNSRRQFLTHSAALAAAPLLASVAGRAIAQAPERKLGVALCGLGSLATNQIAPALLKTRNCRLAGIVTGTPSKAEEWKKKYGIPAKSVYDYQTMSRIADNKDIDIVYVVTPNALHLEHTLAAAAAGKHVFCEKPMEISVERCQQMIDAVKKAGRMLGVGYRCQFEPNNLECVRLAKEKVLGDVKIIDANFGFAMVSLRNPDFARFPRFAEALAASQVAELTPGDAIFIPFGWWHHVEALEPFNVLANYWWNDARQAGSPFDCMLHAILSLRDLPDEQRAVWRTLFEHYVFTPGDESMAHLPREQRGMLGPPSNERTQAIRNILARAFGR